MCLITFYLPSMALPSKNLLFWFFFFTSYSLCISPSCTGRKVTQIFYWSGSLLYLDYFILFLTQPYVIQALLGKKKKVLFRIFCDGHLPGTSLLRNTLIMTHLRALAHRICVFLFGNIAFFLFLWRLYVLDESGMRKDLCLLTKSFALGGWHSLPFPNASFPAHYSMILLGFSMSQHQTSEGFEVGAFPQPNNLFMWVI